MGNYTIDVEARLLPYQDQDRPDLRTLRDIEGHVKVDPPTTR